MTLRGAPPRRADAPLLASGLLLGLAFPPFHLLVPSFVALVPLALWVARLPGGHEGRRRALRGGFLAGLVYFSLLLYWLAAALVFYTPAAVLAFAVPVAVLSGLLALATLGMHQAVRRLRWPVWLALPVFWTAMEWVRAHLGDLAFPWMQLGDSLTGWPRLLGAADLVGSRGLSFWLALVNGLLAEAVLRRRPAALERWLPSAGRRPGDGERHRRGADPGEGGAAGRGRAGRAVAAALAVLAVPTAYSLHRWHGLATEPAARVAVIQPDVPAELELPAGAAADSLVASVERLLGGGTVGRPGGAGGLDVVVLPETSVPVPVMADPGDRRPLPPELDGWITGLADRMGAPVLYGAPARDRRGPGARRYNAAFLRGPGGRRLGWYAKRRLVPVVERAPFLDPDLLPSWPADGPGPGLLHGYRPGPDPELLPAGDARFGVLICYESVFADLSRAYRRRGADFLVNLSNDAWFGRSEPAWARTSGLWQHPAHLVMRAVETRTGVVRSANTGVSGVVDPLGRWTRRTPLFEAAAFAAPVLTTRGTTLFVRWGDVVGAAAALAAAVAAVLAGARPARRPGGRGRPGRPPRRRPADRILHGVASGRGTAESFVRGTREDP